MAASQTFRALGDPVRLEMVRRLASGVSHTIADVSGGLCISRQGARKHLQVLVDAEIVTLRPQGREVYVHLDAAALERARACIAELERVWDRRLDTLRRFIEES